MYTPCHIPFRRDDHSDSHLFQELCPPLVEYYCTLVIATLSIPCGKHPSTAVFLCLANCLNSTAISLVQDSLMPRTPSDKTMNVSHPPHNFFVNMVTCIYSAHAPISSIPQADTPIKTGKNVCQFRGGWLQRGNNSSFGGRFCGSSSSCCSI